MIKSFKHKGLRKFFETGAASGVNPKHRQKLRLLLGMLDAAVSIKDLNAPGLRLHRLTGNRSDYHSITVSANWRLTFQFNKGDVFLVNYEDYH